MFSMSGWHELWLHLLLENRENCVDNFDRVWTKASFWQQQSVYTIFSWDVILPEYLHDLPQHPLSCSELPQEWPVEMVETFLMVPCAMGRDVCFGELQVTEGCDCGMETIQNAQCKLGWEGSLQQLCGCGRWCSIYACADACIFLASCLQ